jgi:hypothetical protein
MYKIQWHYWDLDAIAKIDGNVDARIWSDRWYAIYRLFEALEIGFYVWLFRWYLRREGNQPTGWVVKALLMLLTGSVLFFTIHAFPKHL